MLVVMAKALPKMSEHVMVLAPSEKTAVIVFVACVIVFLCILVMSFVGVMRARNLRFGPTSRM